MQTFLNLDSTDGEIIYSSENNSVIQSLNKRVNYLIIYILENLAKLLLQISILKISTSM